VLVGLPWSWGGIKNLEGSGALVHGFVNSSVQVGAGADPEALAELAIELGVAPELDDSSLRRILAGLVQRAESGDPEAARVALEIARRQRAEPEE
jgi:hypothetical protein